MDANVSPQSDEPASEAPREKQPFRIKIGSQREEETAAGPAEPALRAAVHEERPRAEKIDPPCPSVPAELEPEESRGFPPPRLQSLPPDLEDEISETLSGVSMEQILGGRDAGQAIAAELEVDGRYQATVVKVHRDDIFFSLPGRHEGVASAKQLPEPPALGRTMEVIVAGFNQEDGLYELRIPGASTHVEDWSDLAEGVIVEARVTGHNSGGLECEVGGIRGFIPASHVSLYRVENLAQFVDQKLPCVVTEVDPARRNLVLSHRAVLEREREEARQQLLDSLQPGQMREGVVRSIRDFGAFVDLGGVDGLVHISQLSWDRVNHPSEVLEEGQRIKVKVEKVDHQTGRISLSYRDLLENPWDNIETKFPVHSIVKGRVSRIANFGAFVRLQPGVEGLVHISELAYHRVTRVENVVREDEEVEVKVLSVDRASQRISLSLKAAQAAVATDFQADQAEPAGEGEAAAARPSQRPRTALKGGVDRRCGGEDVGLRW